MAIYPSTIAEALATAAIVDKVDAQMLLQHVLDVEHAFLLTHPEQILTEQQHANFLNLIQRRMEGVPVAYLTGQRAFYDLTFKVSDAVLIPRPETELLVDLALQHIPADKPLKILDLGTGSGAIAITIAKHRPYAQVTAVDVSSDAITVCRSNASNLRVNNLRCITASWFDELSSDTFDLIVSNPPYVAEADPHLQQGDLRFEPRLALSAGTHGLTCIQHIISMASGFLVNAGWLLFEHGYDQAEECRRLLRDADFSNICSYPDLAGIMRVSGGQATAFHSGSNSSN
ncbi:peptide chain release factor N(5)-glutamine methyltransferase [Nitrosomonas sp. JL21]|uniref:peptide chain release factor N(5)-glutamine methyltransferase n=1 Tax=Nitrosomonas sp. JL21 TaxID=153949 RepID=UPI0013DDE12E|nr:peptide chain release factor N(5)-glutamine methyltransferase [Nitrosomonas sp. JL21]